MEFSVLCSLHLAAEATARCLLVQPPQFMQQEDLGQGPGARERALGPFPQKWSSVLGKGEPSWQERKVDSEYPPEGPEAGQMLGKSQLMRKEAFNSPYFPSLSFIFYFFLNEEMKKAGKKLLLVSLWIKRSDHQLRSI